MANYVAIGDIHGRFDLLNTLLDDIEKQFPEHKLLFLGDYIDRGPQSYQVVETIKGLCEAEKAIAIKGNHEAMMLDYAANARADYGTVNGEHIWLYNGGRRTIDSYCKEIQQWGFKGFINALKKSHWQWLKDLPLYFETDEIWASHAPIAAQDSNKEFRQNPDMCYWTYEPVALLAEEGQKAYNHGKLAICGHIHRLHENELEPRIYDHIIYADTGCGCAPYGPLTGVVIENGKYRAFFQATPDVLPTERKAVSRQESGVAMGA